MSALTGLVADLLHFDLETGMQVASKVGNLTEIMHARSRHSKFDGRHHIGVGHTYFSHRRNRLLCPTVTLIKPSLINMGTLCGDAVRLSVCRMKHVHKNTNFSKTKQFRTIVSIDDL